MKNFHQVLPLGLAAVLLGMAIGRGGDDAQDPNTDPAAFSELIGGETTPVELADVALHAREHLGRQVSFTLQVESLPEQWNPYLTRFGTDDYRAVVAWGDEQNLWDPEQYGAPAATLYVRRGGTADAALATPGRYARFAAVGVVRQVFLGRPWIELTRLEPLAQQFTEGSMIHAARGVELMAAGHWELAAQSFERALASDLPARAREELGALRGICQARAPKTPVVPVPPGTNGTGGPPKKGES